MFSRQHGVAVLQGDGWVEVEASRLLGQHLERALELDERAEVEGVEGDRHHAIERPHGAVLLVSELHPEAELCQ